LDEHGAPVSIGTVGELALVAPSIGMTRSLWNDDARYLESYWSAFPGKWKHGDWAMVDSDGYWYIRGRSDDTLKVAGKRTGPAEIEGLLAATGHVVESAVVGLPDPIKGHAVCCVVVLSRDTTLNGVVRGALSRAVVEGLGAAFRPAHIVAVPELPKTRNMKVMRRIVRAVAVGDPPGDLSSLVNPESVELLRGPLRAEGIHVPKASW